MDYRYSSEHKMLIENIRNFVKKEIAPQAREIDEKAQFINKNEIVTLLGRNGVG